MTAVSPSVTVTVSVPGFSNWGRNSLFSVTFMINMKRKRWRYDAGVWKNIIKILLFDISSSQTPLDLHLKNK